jgi:uncharacterized protein (TIGR02594 family)
MPLNKTNNSAMTQGEIKLLQSRLEQLGIYPGPIDGIMGPHTESAIITFKREVGLKLRPYVGPITWKLLFDEQQQLDLNNDLPWMIEAKKALNRHEVYDNQWLKDWLRSDGHALGDPAKLPWCGDFVETPIRLALPTEPIPRNPYWALNWRGFGISTLPTYGCVASIERKGGGHVGFIVGEDARRYYMAGGNQSNKSSIVPVDKGRFVPESFRWPSTYPPRPIHLPQINSDTAANTQED